MLRPESEAELVEVIRSASGPLSVRGGGTRGMAGPGAPLTTAGLAGPVLYEPGALTLVVRAGTPVADIETMLAAEGQRLAFEPMDHRPLLGTGGQPTIGGVVAANVSGPRRVNLGAARDFLLGVRFVDGTGMLVKNGGRVMKNVTGYDLARLMAGARGTLGVLSEVALKVLPAPESVATLALPGLDAAAAVPALSAALGSPWDVTGAAWTPDLGAVVRIEGFARSVAYRRERLAGLLGGFGEVTVLEADPWVGIRGVAAWQGRDGDVWRLSVRPSDAPAVLEWLPGDTLLDWGGGLIWARVPEGTDLRAKLTVPGHATLVRAAPDTLARLGAQQPEPAAVAALTAGLRARFDPRGLFSPAVAEA